MKRGEIEMESVVIAGILWMVIMACMVFLPRAVGTKPWHLWQVLALGAALIPISYFIVNWQMNK